jgi:hypothetical protein
LIILIAGVEKKRETKVSCEMKEKISNQIKSKERCGGENARRV